MWRQKGHRCRGNSFAGCKYTPIQTSGVAVEEMPIEGFLGQMRRYRPPSSRVIAYTAFATCKATGRRYTEDLDDLAHFERDKRPALELLERRLRAFVAQLAMRIPNAAEAVVPEEKLIKYLLALSHPVGGSKARFFRAHGFNKSAIGGLVEGLKAIAGRGEARAITTPFGTKYVVAGDLPTPRGTTIRVETVWIIEANETRPRFVTAYPA